MGFVKLVYDERAYAEKMLNGEKDDIGNAYSVAILARWFKEQHIKEMGITYEELYNNRRKKKEVNDKVWHEVYDFYLTRCGEALDATDLNRIISKYTNRYKLKTTDNPVFITKSEKAVIESLEDEKDRRMMFAYLVHSKFARLNSVSIFSDNTVDENTWFTIYDNNIQFLKRLAKTVGLKPRADEMTIGQFRRKMWADPRGYIEEYKTTKQDTARRYMYIPTSISKLNCVDIDSSPENVVEWITDYDNLDLHYERLFGLKNIGTCEMCGKLFRKGRSNQKYCTEHRGYVKKGLKLVKCEDCGKEFYVPATNKRQVRCEECQQKRRKEAKRIAAQKHRDKLKMQPA